MINEVQLAQGEDQKTKRGRFVRKRKVKGAFRHRLLRFFGPLLLGILMDSEALAWSPQPSHEELVTKPFKNADRGQVSVEFKSDTGELGHCLASITKEAVLLPAHCIPSSGVITIPLRGGALGLPVVVSQARDYALLEGPKSPDLYKDREKYSVLTAKDIHNQTLKVGQLLWVHLKEGWIKAHISAWGAGAVWATTDQCVKPGDSGAQVWALDQKEWQWAGILISGPLSQATNPPVYGIAPDGENSKKVNCAYALSILPLGAVAWGILRPE